MGQAERTTKLLLDFSEKEKGGANRSKRAALSATSEVLNQARGFYLDFFLAHPEKLFERVQLVNKETGEVREAVISADKLLSLSQSIRRFPPQSTPILLLSGISARASPISPGSIAARSSRTASAKLEPITRLTPPGSRQERRKASQGYLPLPITRLSTRESFPSSLIRLRSRRAL
jgi:hypothetical protein